MENAGYILLMDTADEIVTRHFLWTFVLPAIPTTALSYGLGLLLSPKIKSSFAYYAAFCGMYAVAHVVANLLTGADTYSAALAGGIIGGAILARQGPWLRK